MKCFKWKLWFEYVTMFTFELTNWKVHVTKCTIRISKTNWTSTKVTSDNSRLEYTDTHQRNKHFYHCHKYSTPTKKAQSQTKNYRGNLFDAPFLSVYRICTFFFFFLNQEMCFYSTSGRYSQRSIENYEWKASKKLLFIARTILFIWTHFTKHTHPGDSVKLPKQIIFVDNQKMA